MSNNIDYSELVVLNPGRAPRDNQIVNWSHFNDQIDTSNGRLAGNSRIWGDADLNVQIGVINALVNEARANGLSIRDQAILLSEVRIESGFNPDAAAGTTSASGPAQFINDTGEAYGLTDANRWDLQAQTKAAVDFYIWNKNYASSHGYGEEYIYALHHDGTSLQYGGLDLSRDRVMPVADQYETILNNFPDGQIGSGIAGIETFNIDPLWVSMLYDELRDGASELVGWVQDDLYSLLDMDNPQNADLTATQTYTGNGERWVFSNGVEIYTNLVDGTKSWVLPNELGGMTTTTVDGNGFCSVTDTTSLGAFLQTQFIIPSNDFSSATVYTMGSDGQGTSLNTIHVVSSGDTLSAIAESNGVPLSTLLAANLNITDPDSINAGQQINIPNTVMDGNASNITEPVSLPDSTFWTGDGGWLIDDVEYFTGLARDEIQSANPGVNLDNLDGVSYLNLTPADNTLLDVSTSTIFDSSYLGATDFDSISLAVSDGILGSGSNYTYSSIDSIVNGGGLSNSLTGDFITDGIRPGDQNLATSYDFYPYRYETTQVYDRYIEEYVWVTYSHNGYNQVSSLLTATSEALFATYIDPLILDLDGDGVKLSSYLEAGVLFDIDHDTSLEQTGWVSPTDGILVVDINGNGTIDNSSEMISEYFNGVVGTPGVEGEKLYVNGFDALASLDTNADGIFSAADGTNWSLVQTWIDANSDGVTDAGELHSLDSLGISAVNLNATIESGAIRDGNEVLASGTFTIDPGTGPVVREAIAANFLANPNGATFTEGASGLTATSDAGDSAYVSNITTGELIDVAVKGVDSAYGASGDDTLIGDAGINWLGGGAGSDTFNAGAGDDVLLIDAADIASNINGGDGFDIALIMGNEGVTLNLSDSNIELVDGGRGNDTLIGGGRSNVFIRGGDGNDIIIGGGANDVLSGEGGDDIVDGGAGNDIVRGHRGEDRLIGGAGDDIIDGGLDDDKLYGGTGNDVLKGGQGDDYIYGGVGIDVADFSGSFGEYRITQTEEGVWVADTVSGRDGTDFLVDVEKLTFRDVSSIELSLDNPMPINDVLDVPFATGSSAPHLILKDDLLKNDIDYQNDSLHITALVGENGAEVTTVGVQLQTAGGMVELTAEGNVLFTPDPTYTGAMQFQYKIADTDGTPGAQAVFTGSDLSAEMKATVYLRTTDQPSDPLLTDQWYISAANILPVWNDYTGKGVRIGMFEPGSEFAVTEQVFDYRHSDLSPNVDSSWLASGAAVTDFSNHATLVAGVMVAANNGEGAVGVAYDASLTGYYVNNDGMNLNALHKMTQFDIANNSWSANPNFVANFDNNPQLRNAFEYSVANGREGLGTAIIMAGGNARQDGGNTNYLSISNNRFSITTGAYNADADLGALQIGSEPFSNPGASILVSAPGSNVTSTSRLLENDNGSVFGSSHDVTQGTSFATPIVSGIVALMLEANPNLGYRDIQEILAVSAKKIEDPDTIWQDNGAGNWNGGAMHISHDYGFGEVDALAAVRLAETWATQQTYAKELHLLAPLESGALNSAIPDNSTTGISHTLNVSGATLAVEHAEITVNLTHARAGDLIIKLISPTGTESILANRPGKAPGSDVSDRGDTLFYDSDTLNFTFTSVRHWGESANGDWTLQVIDAATGDIGTLNSWSIDLNGKQEGHDTYYYTNEITKVSAGRRTLAADTNGGVDTINAAAASGNSTINLTTGAGTIAGTGVTFTTPANLENAIGGEGNDTITGNALANLLQGGRGDDTINGGSAFDVLWGGLGNDILTGGSETDAFVIEKESGAVDTVTDFLIGTDRIILSGFGDTNGNNVSLLQEGANTRIDLGDGQSVLLLNVDSTTLTASAFVSVKDGMAARDFADYNGWGFGTDFSDGQAAWGSRDIIYWAGDGGEYVFGGTGNDRLMGGAGNDILVGENNSSLTTGGNDQIYGEDGIDQIYGGGGDDILSGGSNIDVVFGNAGNDTIFLEGDQGMNLLSSYNIIGSNITVTNPNLSGAKVVGGTGNDRFVVVEDTSMSASQGLAKNLIEDFEVSNPNEKIDLSQVRAVSSFSELTFSNIVADGVQYLRVFLGPLYSGTQYITLKNVTQDQLSADNFIFWDGLLPVAEVKDILINGTAGDDTLTGNAGGNTLDGGVGADTMTGRTGDDTYIVDNVNDSVFEQVGGGFDTVKSSVDWVLGHEVENLILTGINSINATGNNLANRIVGNIGNNIIDGQGGADSMLGGAGNDTYIVDNGSDSIIEHTAEGLDSVQSSVSYTLGANIEDLTLTGFDHINATGNDLSNVLTGNTQNNILDGGRGADSLTGGFGDDTYLVDNIGDVVTEQLNQGNDTVYASISRTLSANVENLVLSGFSDINGTGNILDNKLKGNSGSNMLVGGDGADTLDGGTGADTLVGGTGNDTYVVDDLGDTVTENVGEGIDTVHSTIDFTLADKPNIENITLKDLGNINATGNDVNNVLIGNIGDNTLTGGAGNDVLNGGRGTDVMSGGLGDDTYYVDSVSDSITELAGQGTDTIISSISMSLATEPAIENLSLTGTSAIDATGNDQNNTLIGNYGSNVLSGGGGNDRLNGWHGEDTLYGGAGDDTYVVNSSGDVVDETGGNGNDTIEASIDFTLGAGFENLELMGTAVTGTGNSLNNIITGNSSANTLSGGAGNDVLIGQTGDDVYVFSLGDGQDEIIDLDLTSGNVDKVVLQGINKADVTVTQDLTHVIIDINATSDQLRIRWSPADGYDVESFEFADGVLSAAQLLNKAPVVAVAQLDQVATEDAIFSYTLPVGTFSDTDAGDSLTYSATLSDGTALPTWLSFDALTQTFSGTPTNGDVGSLSINVTATDSGSLNATDNITLTINNVNDAPVVTVAQLDQVATEDAVFSYTLPVGTFSDIDAGDSLTYSATLSDGTALPTWLSFDALTQTFSGTPTNGDVGSLSINVTATDSGSLNATDNITLTINNVNDAPVVTVAQLDQVATEDAVFSYTLPVGTFSDIDAGDALTYSATLSDGTALPTWLNFDAVTQTFSGTPTNSDVGSLNINIVATDIGGLNAIDTVALTINNVNDAPVVTVAQLDQVATENAVFSYTMPVGTFSDIDAGDSLTYSATLSNNSALPTWLSFDALTQTFSGTPSNNEIGQITIIVTATDTSGEKVTDSFNIGVNPLNGELIVGTVVADTLTGGTGNDYLQGLAGDDVLDSATGNDTLVGGIGNDTLIGGSGNDVYQFNAGDGQDLIRDTDSTVGNVDTVAFNSGQLPLDIVFQQQGNDLLTRYNGGLDQVTIENWYSGETNQTEQFETSDGSSLVNTQVDQLIQAMATFSTENGGITWDQAILDRPMDVQTILTSYWQ